MIDPPRMHVTNMVLNHAKNPTDGPSDHFPWFRVLKRARRTTTLTTVAHGEDHLPLLFVSAARAPRCLFLLPSLRLLPSTRHELNVRMGSGFLRSWEGETVRIRLWSVPDAETKLRLWHRP